MLIHKLSRDTPEALTALIESYAFKPYRNYRALSRRRQDAVLSAEIAEGLRVEGSFGFVAADGAGGEVSVAAMVRPLPWDTEFFGIRMARLQVLRSPDSSMDGARGVVAAALQESRDRGLQHLAVRLDVADTQTLQLLEDAGFRMMDALATYIYHHKREAPAPVKEMGVIRLFRPEDTESILEITREAYRGFLGRYHLDPHLPRERSDELYLAWARKSCAGEWAQVVLVTENSEGDISGWASYRTIEPVSSVGQTPIQGGGLGACRRDRPGAYAGLIRAAAVRIHGGGGVTECQTQLFNFSTIRIYEAVGTQFVRADYTLHAWLG